MGCTEIEKKNGCFLSETVPHPFMGSVWYCSSAPLKCMLGPIPIAGIIQDPWKKTSRWILWRSHRKQQGKCSHPLWQSKHAKRVSGVFLWVWERGHMWWYTLLHCRYTYLCMSTLLICTVFSKWCPRDRCTVHFRRHDHFFIIPTPAVCILLHGSTWVINPCLMYTATLVTFLTIIRFAHCIFLHMRSLVIICIFTGHYMEIT